MCYSPSAQSQAEGSFLKVKIMSTHLYPKSPEGVKHTAKLRFVMKEREHNEKTFEEIGQMIGVCGTRARQLYIKGINRRERYPSLFKTTRLGGRDIYKEFLNEVSDIKER